MAGAAATMARAARPVRTALPEATVAALQQAPAGMKGGGKVKGPGTGTSDSVRTMLSKGEFVMPADSVRKIGVKTLMAMKDATHKPTGKPSRGPVRRMADGGLVDDRLPNRNPAVVAPGDAPMPYGQQMANVGGAIANGAAYLAKTVVGYPGYGINSGSTAAPAAVPAATPAPLAPGATSTVQGGRGTVNPPVASLTGDARPDLAGVPSLGGATGTAVDGAPGVRKFTQGASTLYSNVAGADNDKLMSSNPGVQVVPALGGAAAQMAAAPAATTYAQPGALTSTPGLSIASGKTIFDDNKADAAAGGARSVLGGAISGREAARLANASTIAAEQNATSRANAQTGAAAQLGSSQIGAGASMYGANTQAGTAANRLAMETPEVKARTAELTAQASLRQGTAAAQQALLAAKTPEERKAAEENLRATLGKDHIVRGIGVSLPAQANGLPGGGAVWDDRTQTFQYPQAPDASAPKYETGKVYQDAKGNKATWNGQKFVPA